MTTARDPATEVITPEAVSLGFEDATVGTRGVAAVVDFAIIGLTLLVLQLGGMFAGVLLGAQDWVAVTIVIVLVFLLMLGYPIGFETLWRGRTPGKALLGLRVVTVEGAPIGFRHAVLRAVLGLIELRATVGAVALLVSALSRRGQRLGDHVAGTVVVREGSRRKRAQPLAVTVPAGYEAYAESLDTSGATAEDYHAVRAFLQRRDELTAEARARISNELATRLATRLGLEPDRRVTAETFLECFAARYQQRDTARW